MGLAGLRSIGGLRLGAVAVAVVLGHRPGLEVVRMALECLASVGLAHWKLKGCSFSYIGISSAPSVAPLSEHVSFVLRSDL